MKHFLIELYTEEGGTEFTTYQADDVDHAIEQCFDEADVYWPGQDIEIVSAFVSETKIEAVPV